VSTSIDRFQVQALLAQGAQLIDVLPEREYRECHIRGAHSIPLKQFSRAALASLDPAQAVIVYCHDAQ
jgi:rhodanese-related sulfurtransferase